MTSFNAPQFDDELLSAYLDGELSAEERARVEEHLAANPQAQKLLDELRGVSQALRALPPAKLGVDLSGAIVRQAERAAKDEARTAAGGASEAAWSMPIGRSKRSWFWAGAALAAGLMLMFFERGANERGDLPNQVAVADRDMAREPMGHTELRALPPQLAESRAVPKEEQAVDLFADAPAAPATTDFRTNDAKGPAPAVVGLERGREMAAVDASQKLKLGVGAEALADDMAGDMVVVHVNTTPEAMRKRAFDAVLVKNSIEPERPATVAASNTPPSEVDVVLVEAAPFQILGCMDELKKDSKNYLAIEVDEQSVANQRAKSLDDQADKFALYNRGVVPVEQKVASNRFYYSQQDAGAAAGTQEQADKVAATAPQPPMQVMSRQQEALGRSDAMSVDTLAKDAAGSPVTTFGGGGVAGGQPSEGALYSQSTASDQYYGANVQNNARRAVQKLATKADMLQVLFVFSCPIETPALQPSTALDASSTPPAATASEPVAAPDPTISPAREGIDD
jgi:hypothetical protein